MDPPLMPSLKLLPTIFIEALVDMDVIMESAMKTLEEEALEPIVGTEEATMDKFSLET